MDLWERARSFAGEAAKRSQELSLEAAKRSSVLVSETAKKSKEIFSETATKSREIAAEATKQADLLAGQIMHLASDIPVPSIPPIPAIPPIPSAAESAPDAAELERYGITEDLRDFVNGMTISTFRDFPLQGAGHTHGWVLGDLRRWNDSDWISVAQMSRRCRMCSRCRMCVRI
jgi:hypothetical protein